MNPFATVSSAAIKVTISLIVAMVAILSLVATGCKSLAQDMKGAASATVQQQGQHQDMVKQENEIIDEAGPQKSP